MEKQKLPCRDIRGKVKRVHVRSIEKGEGTITIAAGLAMMPAETGEDVTFIDCDAEQN